MKLDLNKKILIVGLGLIGGSYARALTKKGYYVTAITRSQSSIDYALAEGIIARGAARVAPELITEADVIVFSLYPHIFVDWIRENQKYFKPGTIITDVTGVKTNIVKTIQDMLREDVEFIAAHPMAGREVYGVQNSDDAIFKGANYVVTPSKKILPMRSSFAVIWVRSLVLPRFRNFPPKSTMRSSLSFPSSRTASRSL